MELNEIKELAKILKDNDLTALEINEKGTAIKLERRREAFPPPPRPEAPGLSPGLEEPQAPAPLAGSREKGTMVLSPTVGVFYTSASPESEPFVKVGDTVKRGDTLCIIEAMKLMNEIPAELDGTIAEVCASNGQVVEFDQPLFRII